MFLSWHKTTKSWKIIKIPSEIRLIFMFGPRPSFFQLWTSFWLLFGCFWLHFGVPLGEPRTRFWLFFTTWAAQGSPGTPQMVPNAPMAQKVIILVSKMISPGSKIDPQTTPRRQKVRKTTPYHRFRRARNKYRRRQMVELVFNPS